MGRSDSMATGTTVRMGRTAVLDTGKMQIVVSEKRAEPYDLGVFYGAFEKGGLKVVCLPQLYADFVNYERRGREQAEHLRREAMGY